MELKVISVIETKDGMFHNLKVYSIDPEGIKEAIERFKKCVKENDPCVNFKVDVDNMDFSYGDQTIKLDDYCVMLKYIK